MKKQRLLLISNPRAGLAQGTRSLARISEIFFKAGYSVMIHITDSAGDAENICAELGGEYDMVVCIGGDGTLNEVINGLMKLQKRPKLGYIPAGTTNDFASSLGLSKSQITAAKNIAEGREHTIDVGCFDGRYFSYIASFGAFTEASYASDQNVKNVIGSLAYIFEGIKDITNLKSCHVKVETGEETIEGDFAFGAFSNSTSIAGLIRLKDNDVDFSDGLFEIMLIRMPQNLVDLNKIVNSLLTQNYNEEVMIFSHASKAVLTLGEDRSSWTVDGEYRVSGRTVEITNVRGALTMVY